MADAFPNDRDYTYESITQHLNAIELAMRDGSHKSCKPINLRMRGELLLIHKHFKDGSWRLCKCSPEKHLPTVVQFAQEGVAMSQSDKEMVYMENLRDTALTYARRLDEGQLTDAEAQTLSRWAGDTYNYLKKNNSSWSECGSSPDDLLLGLSGFASESIGFTDDPVEKHFMIAVRDTSYQYYLDCSRDRISDEMAEEIRGWSRGIRRRVTRKKWRGDLPKTSRKDEVMTSQPQNNGKSCPTCTIVPDKYKKRDYRMVSMPTKGYETVSVKRKSGSDIIWVDKGY